MTGVGALGSACLGALAIVFLMRWALRIYRELHESIAPFDDDPRPDSVTVRSSSCFVCRGGSDFLENEWCPACGRPAS